MQIKKNKPLSTTRVSSRFGRVGLFGVLSILSALVVAMICPVAPEEAQAASVSAGGSTLSVSVSNSTVALTVDPSVNSGIARGSVVVSAKTTNLTGYTMKMNVSDTTAMKSTTSSNTATIPTLSANTVLTSFPANRWGYYFGASEGTNNTTYKPFSTTATQIDATTAANSTLRNQTLTIATKVNNALPASTYTAKIVVSVVSNIIPITSIQYMQDITSAYCADTSVGTETQLTDKRDGKKYWVGKMKDGRCWMLQNLALDIPATGLKASDTDITADWNSSSTYPPVATRTTVGGAASATAVNSWNFGTWVLATPLLTTECSNTIANCTKVGFVDVSNTTNFKPTYTATTGTWNGATVTSNTLVTVNCTAWSGSGTGKICTAGTYDAHYLVGNYYTWNAVTAGTGGTMTSGLAQVSICPKGWELPIMPASGQYIPLGAKIFSDLLVAYGVSSSLSGTVDGVTYNIAGAPLRFVRSGLYGTDGNLLAHSAKAAYYWSSVPYSGKAYAYSLLINADGVKSTGNNYNYRYNGLSVRCVLY